MEPTAPPSRPADAPVADDGARPPRRRRKWIAIGALGLGLVALLVFSGGGSSRRDVALAFAGFTNYEGNVRVCFWVTNEGGAFVDVIRLASKSDGTNWINERGSSLEIHQPVPDMQKDQSWSPPFPAVLVSIQVNEPVLPLRLVTEVWEQPVGLKKLEERWVRWYSDRRGRVRREVAGIRHYYVTNEFWPKP